MSGSAPTSVLLVDSHPISLTGLRTIVGSCSDLLVAGVAHDGPSAAARCRELRPQVVIVNAHGAAEEALDSVEALSAEPSAANVLVLVDDVDAAAGQVLRAGARGLLPSASSSRELAAAVRIMATGRSLLIPTVRPAPGASPLDQLTERETEVFRLLTRGLSNAEISAELTLSQSTVKSHIQKVMEKLGLRNRVHAVIFAYEQHIIHAGP